MKQIEVERGEYKITTTVPDPRVAEALVLLVFSEIDPPYKLTVTKVEVEHDNPTIRAND